MIWDEASVGLLPVFLEAGYEVVASPTLRRRVVRRRIAWLARGSRALGSGEFFHEIDDNVILMKSSAPTLLPLLRSQAQADIIAWIVLHPDHEFSLAEIARAVNVSGPTVMREVDRLTEAGLVRERRRGNQRLVRAATDNAVYPPLAALMSVTFGPVPVLRELLTGVPGVREAWIYGSWAARNAQQPGPVPGDIDVLVVGTADPDALDDVAQAAQGRLGRDVNIRRVRPSAWDQAAADPFRTTVTSRPMVALVGGDVA